MADSTYVAGALLRIREDDESVYTVTQVPYGVQLPRIVQGVEDDRIEIDWSFAVVKTVGYAIKSTYEIGVEVVLLGIQLGTFYGNLKDGLVINVDLFVMKGQLSFYLKNGNDTWVSVDLRGVTRHEKDIKLFSF